VSAREEVLRRVRAALGPAPAVPEVERAYRRAGRQPPGSRELVERLCERLSDYRATVWRADASDVGEVVARACAERSTARLHAAPGIDSSVPGVEVVTDGPEVTMAELDAVGAALTGCALAIAETGTLVLDGGPLSGRRVLTLVPDHHVCVVRADQVVADVPDAVAALSGAPREGRPVTLVSGPSATSDIELERVEGVHGPRKLDVVVVGAR
jgi:L-lactate dehydrogenase complex protein LldG